MGSRRQFIDKGSKLKNENRYSTAPDVGNLAKKVRRQSGSSSRLYSANWKETACLEQTSRLIKKYQQSDPFLCGYPVVDHDAVLYRYRNEVQTLLDTSGLTHEEQEKYLLSTLRNLIDCIHLVPASRYHHHRTMGGLLEHSIECAIYVAEAVPKSRTIRKASSANENIPLSRWMLGAILCGLLHDASKAVVDAQIYSADRKDKYIPTQRFMDWAVDKVGVGNVYFVYWKSQPMVHEEKLRHMLSTFNIIDSSTYLWLDEPVIKEMGKFFKNSPSVFSFMAVKADRESIGHSLRKGQYLRSTETPFDHERVNFFEAVKRLLFLGSQYQETSKSKEIIDEGDIKVCGWTIDSPDSAVIRSGECLDIVFDQLKQVRIAYEIDNVESNLFDFKNKTSDLSSRELEKELERLVNHLVKMGCLCLCNGSPYWYRQRSGPNAGVPVKTICLTPRATKLVLEYKKPLIPGTKPYFVGHVGGDKQGVPTQELGKSSSPGVNIFLPDDFKPRAFK